ncbi:hypothetical protein D3273_22685 [Lichenibacterium minor]|uniref:Uncharacterized protein n=1 Tax=Lichenibacterium minor TaxID=2316528 RepID=A0A4Q2U4G8_9HYPH|nr:hypothetical protein [Lichenibacterium minor]RYC29685.1 hypothetical protein D3273_22685 [Lichenibacterium minor]
MAGYGYTDYGYSSYGYGYNSYGYGRGYYAISPGAYNAPYINLSGPGSSGYYVEYSGSTKFVNSAYENYYGGKSTYAATLSPDGNFTQSSYNYRSAYRTESDIETYISHATPSAGGYFGYDYHQTSLSYQSIDVTTYTSGDYKYFNTISYDSDSFFDGSSSTAYSETTLTEENGLTVPGSSHTYSTSSYTDPSGYTAYHSSQT